MKKPLLLAILFLANTTIFAQDFRPLADIKFATAEECRTYNSKALEAADFILSTPVNGSDVNRLSAMSFLIKWMTSTADYTFELNADVTKYGKEEDMLLAVYMACLTKFVMDNADKGKDSKEITYGAMKLFADYCANEKNNVQSNKRLKKLLDANKEGKLKEYLKL
ncbi:hypothetical protein ESA94_14930 [Lacibacter luteus]|uniref:Uncharacterized protein n=1 Tax=Lacibacter luteus TaxID=2508719 RepID=A0A4Q1CGX9_9BACT|nr:hypothetical protein [Lacibacter luteus]RXK59425.1 hypothetical protein ESA94_14930 [Lacibacter luteus]